VHQISDETFWTDLLSYIEDGKVIPVIGKGALTVGDDDQPFEPWLVRKLAPKIGVELPQDGPTPTLNEIIIKYLVANGEANLPYLRLHQLLEQEKPKPGPTLRALAWITDFRLFLTTSFDPLLQRAIEDERLGGQPLLPESIGAFSPKAKTVDLPSRFAELRGTHIHHLLGRVSSQPNYVLWEEDALEFMCEFQRRLRDIDNLARDLHEYSLLVLGLHFSDWQARFFLRIAKQRRLSEIRDHFQYLAEGPVDSLPPSMVLFFGGFLKTVTVIPTTPAAFIAELAHRWVARHSQIDGSVDKKIVALPSERIADGDIFLSYAREDETAALQLKGGLEKAGCRVWFDRERLKPGVRWHAHLEDAVKRRCSLFVSLVSHTTETVSEAYYHLERRWAAERLDRIVEDREFYFPVIIDDSPIALAHEPRAVRQFQATCLPGGIVVNGFGEHLCALQQHRLVTPR